MDYTVVWSEGVLDDIDALADYIARDSFFYAQQVVGVILGLGDSLATQPARGRVVPELNDTAIRELFVYSSACFMKYAKMSGRFTCWRSSMGNVC